MEHLNIDGTAKAYRGLWVMNPEGAWRPSLGVFMNIGGTLKKEERTFFYNYGTENFAWVEGYTQGAGSYAKNSDNLYMKCNPSMITGAFFRNWVTSIAIPLGKFSKIYFRGKVTTAGHVVDWGICDAANKMTQNFTKQVRATDTAGWDGTSSLDVSGYTGNYHIKIQAYDGSVRGTKCYIYRIWAQ